MKTKTLLESKVQRGPFRGWTVKLMTDDLSQKKRVELRDRMLRKVHRGLKGGAS